MNENMEEIMLDLLCKKTTEGLTEHEERQLADLEKQFGKDQSHSFEVTAAHLGMAHLDTSEQMPAPLRTRILADAENYFDARTNLVPAPVASIAPEKPVRGSIFNWLGWAFAAAACLALALNISYTGLQPGPVAQGGTPTPTPEEKLTPAQMRQLLIVSAPDLARGNWGAGNMKELSPTGDVVWSDSKQAGYVRLSGLPKNDPGKETYQLWIMAENQDPKTPVDGGTFDVGSDGEVIIPIDAKVKALNPKAFAITVERPGGVPVSKQEKVAALANRET